MSFTLLSLLIRRADLCWANDRHKIYDVPKACTAESIVTAEGNLVQRGYNWMLYIRTTFLLHITILISKH